MTVQRLRRLTRRRLLRFFEEEERGREEEEEDVFFFFLGLSSLSVGCVLRREEEELFRLRTGGFS